MVQRERDEEGPGLTEMVLDSDPTDEPPKAKGDEEARDPPDGEEELPLAGQ